MAVTVGIDTQARGVRYSFRLIAELTGTKSGGGGERHSGPSWNWRIYNRLVHELHCLGGRMHDYAGDGNDHTERAILV